MWIRVPEPSRALLPLRNAKRLLAVDTGAECAEFLLARKKRGQATLISAGDRDGVGWIQVPGPSRTAVATLECQRAVGGSHRCGVR